MKEEVLKLFMMEWNKLQQKRIKSIDRYDY